MNAVDLLGHFAYVLLCLGTVLIAKYPGKNAGWLLRASTCSCQRTWCR